MKMRTLFTLAAFGGLLAAGCKGNNENAADTAGTSAMTDTAGASESMGTTPTGTMTDSAAAAGTTGTMTDTLAGTTGDTTTKR